MVSLHYKRSLISSRINSSRVWAIIFLSASALFLQGCYLSKLAYRHNNLFNSRRLIVDVMGDPGVSKDTKDRLTFVAKVIEFAKSQGLDTDGAYRYYIEMESDSVSYIVQASYPDRLENKTWWYPVVGSVPYKGFYDELERDQEEESLKKLGFDTYAGRVSAFSSLGWFEDPIYSSMLKRDEIRLAALLLHELAHRSFWLEGEAKFNENLATFVENHLVELFFSHEKFKDKLDRYRLAQGDDKLYREWLVKLEHALQEFYKTKQGKMEVKGFQKAKKAIFTEYTLNHMPDFKVLDYIGRKDWNNATILAASLYSPDLKRFEKARLCVAPLKIGQFLQFLKDRCDGEASAYDVLDSLCS